MIGLVDCNNFFVSCERVFRPELARRPVIVLSNNDGCAVALSNEAKALGFKRGDPYFKIRRQAEAAGVIAFSGNHRLYGDMSQRVMTVLRSLVDEIEVYSIDEAFIFPEEINADSIHDYGKYVVQKVLSDTGIPVSLGFASTKTLAKIASRFAKKYPGYCGCCVIDTEQKRRRALELTAVGDVWGIGRRINRRLEMSGIATAAQFADLSHRSIKTMFSIVGERTWRELNGEPCIERESDQPSKQTITSSRSFAKELTTLEQLRSAVSTFADIVGRKLRQQDSFAEELAVFVCTNRFHEHEEQFFNSALYHFTEPCNDLMTLADGACKALRDAWREGIAVKKAGVTITRIVSREGMQPSLFGDSTMRERNDRLMKVFDAINASPVAPHLVRIASMGGGVDDLVKREHASHLYTTRFSDIIKINCK